MLKEIKKEKLVSLRDPSYDGKCPLCKEQGEHTVLPFGDDTYFCENPNCNCTRHSGAGYYMFTNEDPQAPNVTIVEPQSYMKRHVVKKSI